MDDISAKQFLYKSSENIKTDEFRIRELLHKLPYMNQETRERLRSEFLAIICNPLESYAYRGQAVSILWHYSKCLDVVGRGDVSDALFNILNSEFGENKVTDDGSVVCGQCEKIEITFLKEILRAILVIHPKNDWSIPRNIYKIYSVKGTNIGAWFNKISKQMNK